MSFEIKGLDDFTKKLSDIADVAKELTDKEIPLEELFTAEFLCDNTDFDDIQELLDMEGDMDENVQEHSCFRSWEDMKSAALEAYALKKLGY